MIFRKKIENPKLANTARSQQLKFTADPKVSNTARSFAASILSLQASTYPDWESEFFKENTCVWTIAT